MIIDKILLDKVSDEDFPEAENELQLSSEAR